MNIVIIGPPGSGKTTQADLLAQSLGTPHLNTGDLMHFSSLGQDEASRAVKESMEKGQMVDDETAEKLIKQYFDDHKDSKTIVIDGFPRTIAQAEAEIFPISFVYYIKVNDEESVRRLGSRGRADDTEQVIRQRLEIYHQETEPILEYYRKKGVLKEINGERPIEEVSQDLEKRASETVSAVENHDQY